MPSRRGLRSRHPRRCSRSARHCLPSIATSGCRRTSTRTSAEIAELATLFPWAADYLAVYERYGLTGDRSVMAHNVHATDAELERLAAAGTSIAHCPSSNAALGSGIFPFRRHLEAGVACSLGTDVGGGIGFGDAEGSAAGVPDAACGARPFMLDPARMLYLATLAGAEGARPCRRDRRFSPRQSRGPRLSAPSGRQRRRVRRSTCGERPAGARGAVHAGGRRKRQRGSGRRASACIERARP